MLAEYRRAPEVTRQRLYMETMEQVLPGIEKFVVEGDAARILPFIPIRSGRMAGQGMPEKAKP